MNGYIVYHESTFMVYIYFRGYSRNANYAKICTAQKCLGSQYLPAHEVVVISYNEQISLMAHGQRVASHRGNRTRFCPRQHRPRQRCIRGNLRNGNLFLILWNCRPPPHHPHIHGKNKENRGKGTEFTCLFTSCLYYMAIHPKIHQDDMSLFCDMRIRK